MLLHSAYVLWSFFLSGLFLVLPQPFLNHWSYFNQIKFQTSCYGHTLVCKISGSYLKPFWRNSAKKNWSFLMTKTVPTHYSVGKRTVKFHNSASFSVFYVGARPFSVVWPYRNGQPSICHNLFSLGRHSLWAMAFLREALFDAYFLSLCLQWMLFWPFVHMNMGMAWLQKISPLLFSLLPYVSEANFNLTRFWKCLKQSEFDFFISSLCS